jgi:hypothetical protein
MLYVWERDGDITVVGTVLDSDDAMVSRFTEGVPIDALVTPAGLRVEIEAAPDGYPDYFELQRIPIANDKVVQALANSGVDNVTVYPAPLEEVGGRTITGYSVLHIVGRVAALDEAASDLARFRKQVTRIRKMVLKSPLPNELRVFRLHELQYIVLVSEEVRNALRGLSGIIVNPAEGWSDSHQF